MASSLEHHHQLHTSDSSSGYPRRWRRKQPPQISPSTQSPATTLYTTAALTSVSESSKTSHESYCNDMSCGTDDRSSHSCRNDQRWTKEAADESKVVPHRVFKDNQISFENIVNPIECSNVTLESRVAIMLSPEQESKSLPACTSRQNLSEKSVSFNEKLESNRKLCSRASLFSRNINLWNFFSISTSNKSAPHRTESVKSVISSLRGIKWIPSSFNFVTFLLVLMSTTTILAGKFLLTTFYLRDSHNTYT